eukprot:scaffold9990_cov43-Cyclotella_meneghiniana.AAC.1
MTGLPRQEPYKVDEHVIHVNLPLVHKAEGHSTRLFPAPLLFLLRDVLVEVIFTLAWFFTHAFTELLITLIVTR